jgi:hypothetical protein
MQRFMALGTRISKEACQPVSRLENLAVNGSQEIGVEKPQWWVVLSSNERLFILITN